MFCLEPSRHNLVLGFFFIYNKYKTPPPLLFLFPPLSTLRVLINSYPDRFEILHDSIGFSGKILPGGELLDDDVLQTISYSQTGRIVPHLLTQLSSMQELAQNSNLALQKTMFLIAVHFFFANATTCIYIVHVIEIQADFRVNEPIINIS